MRWGSGSLQEIDHLPFVAPLTKSAQTVKETVTDPGADGDRDRRGAGAAERPDLRRLPARRRLPGGGRRGPRAAGAFGRRRRRPLRRGRGAVGRRPSAPRSWPARASTGLRLRSSFRVWRRRSSIPVFLNGMGRGCLPADHELSFSRARGKGLKEADVALVVGVPLDFRLGFGGVVRRGDEDRLPRCRAQPAGGDAPGGDRARRRHPEHPRRPSRVRRGRRWGAPPRRSMARRASRDGVGEA